MKSGNSELEKIHASNDELKKIEAQKEKLEDRLFELNRQIKNNQRKLNNLKRSEKWRERNHKLIEYGALLEIAELLEENKTVLLGYLLNFHSLNDFEKENFRSKGSDEFEKREIKKRQLRMKMQANKDNT